MRQPVKERLFRPSKYNVNGSTMISGTTRNPSVEPGEYSSLRWREDEASGAGIARRSSATRRYYVTVDNGIDWPPELDDYNRRFAKTLGGIKRRHDGVVTTVGKNGPFGSRTRPDDDPGSCAY